MVVKKMAKNNLKVVDLILSSAARTLKKANNQLTTSRFVFILVYKCNFNCINFYILCLYINTLISFLENYLLLNYVNFSALQSSWIIIEVELGNFHTSVLLYEIDHLWEQFRPYFGDLTIWTPCRER